ncbi:MAG: hypothetical protein ACK4PR_03655 [Gammaproteobacteria bacterium]
MPISNNVLFIFNKMLKSDFVPTNENSEINANLLKNHIKTLLDKGAVATMCGSYTPLMLYAAFNITGERLEKELEKDTAYITAEASQHPDQEESTNVNALFLAVISGSLDVFKRLYTSAFFTEIEPKSIVLIAVEENKANILHYLRERGIDLMVKLENISSMKIQMTSLQIACQRGFNEIVEEILLSKPSEDLISATAHPFPDMTAYAIASQEADLSEDNKTYQACMDLLEQHTLSGKWSALYSAMAYGR